MASPLVALRGLALASLAAGDPSAALDAAAEAVGIARTVGEAEVLTSALMAQGEALRAAARETEAGAALRETAEIATTSGDAYEAERAVALLVTANATGSPLRQ